MSEPGRSRSRTPLSSSTPSGPSSSGTPYVAPSVTNWCRWLSVHPSAAWSTWCSSARVTAAGTSTTRTTEGATSRRVIRSRMVLTPPRLRAAAAPPGEGGGGVRPGVRGAAGTHPDRARGRRPRPSQIETAAPRPAPTLAATLKSAHLRPGVGVPAPFAPPVAGGQPRPRGRGRCTRPAGPRPATPPSPAVPSAVPPRAKGPTDEGRPASRLQLPTPAGGRARPGITGPLDVVVRIGGAGVCRTDLHILEGQWAGEVRGGTALHDRPRERRLGARGRRGGHQRRGRRQGHPAPAGHLRAVPRLPVPATTSTARTARSPGSTPTAATPSTSGLGAAASSSSTEPWSPPTSPRWPTPA